jgi:peptidoglycan L-alanyl-D-glutamate endopeptidase CwlK
MNEEDFDPVPLAIAAEELGIEVEWGGDWKRFPDGPHWQL